MLPLPLVCVIVFLSVLFIIYACLQRRIKHREKLLDLLYGTDSQMRNGTNVPGVAQSYVPPPIQTQPYRSVERNVMAAQPSAPPSITEIVITDATNQYNKPRPEDDLPPSYEEALSASKTSLTHSASSSRSNLANTLNAPPSANVPSAPVPDSQPPPPSFEALQVNNRS